MLHPAWVNIISYFYPLGNTPALCLTQDLLPEQKANLLLLGCGDVRNILFTCYADGGSSNLHRSCKEAFVNGIQSLARLTLPAVTMQRQCLVRSKKTVTLAGLMTRVARNILVFTLILDYADGSKDLSIWNIYYHLFLDKEDLVLLSHQGQKLQSLAGSLESWHGSEYGRSLRLCDEGTLVRIRKFWVTNSSSDLNEEATGSGDRKQPQDWLQCARDMQAARFGRDGGNLTGFRSAGPISIESMKDLPILFKHFWEHGTTDQDPTTLSRTGFTNPMFAGCVADALTVHYGTDPLLGFHLATAYASLTPDSPLKTIVGSNQSKVVAAARLQFRNWSASFRERAQKSLMIRFFNGEALAFCHSLQHRRTAGAASPSNWYRDQYQLEPVVLDSGDYGSKGSAPLLFNVIDTSNLVDHLGAINVLTATSQLLDESPDATLYTETLVKREKDLSSLVDSLLCGHFPTMCMLFGLTPIEYWTNSIATSNVEESLLVNVGQNDSPTQVHNRLTFKRLIANGFYGSTIGFSAPELARVLYQCYLDMFQSEDMARMISTISSFTIQNNSLPHYHRGSFASFLLCVKKTVAVDWNEMMNVLVGLIENDSNLIVGRNYIQELYIQLHLLGVFSVPVLRSPIDRPTHPQTTRGIGRWKEIPHAVCITLQVPRVKIQPLMEIPWHQLGTPPLHGVLQSSSNQWQNLFAMVQVAFGSIATTGSRYEDSFKVHVSDDARGWKGQSPLIVSFFAPSWTVLLEPLAAKVALGFQTTPGSAYTFAKRLGLEMNIYMTTLGNEQDVYITKFRPNLSAHTSMCNFKGSSTTTDQHTDVSTSFSVDTTGRVAALAGRMNLLSEETKNKLRGGASVETVQMSPCVIGVAIGDGGSRYRLQYPVPVSRLQSKCRVAPKSSYIEVVAAMADPRYGNGFPYFMHPIFPGERGPVLWNMPRLNLDCLPIVDRSKKKNLQWQNTQACFMFSFRERRVMEESKEARKQVSPDARIALKDSLSTLFISFSGIQGQRARFFGIDNPDHDGIHILIYVSSLRLDLANRTAVLDCAVLPLRHPLMPKITPYLAGWTEAGIGSIKVNSDQLRLWKEMIPVWVERCRHWKHHSSCAYQRDSRVPLSVESGENPLCSCGEGTLPSTFTCNLPRREIFAKYAVRAAISPSFSVPFVEQGFQGQGGPTTSDVESCEVCGRTKSDAGGKSLMRCARCQVVKYCSVECQRRDWKEHKKECKK